MKWILLLFMFAPVLAAQPEMDLLRSGAPVADGGTDSLSNTGPSPFNITYTVENNGTAELNLTGVPEVEIGDRVNCDVTVLVAPATPVAATDSTTFTLQVSPIAATDFSFSVSIASDDADENPYNFNVMGATGAPSGSGDGSSSSDDCTTGEASGVSMIVLLGLLSLAGLAVRAPHFRTRATPRNTRAR